MYLTYIIDQINQLFNQSKKSNFLIIAIGWSIYMLGTPQ